MATPYVPYDGPIVKRSDALAAGLTRFFTGKPCKHGHLGERTACNGACIACNAISIAALYYAEGPEKRALRNAQSQARKAANREKVQEAGRKYSREHREQANAWKAANRDKVNATERAARLRDPEGYKARVDLYTSSDKGKATRRAYYLANAETIKQRSKAAALANPDRALAQKKAHYEANIEAIKQRVRDWNAANPEAARTRGRNYRARLHAAVGEHTGDDIKALFVKQKGRCIYCSKKLGDTYHVDHIQALSRGGSNDPANLQLTCGPCNNNKRATDPIEYARRIGRLL